MLDTTGLAEGISSETLETWMAGRTGTVEKKGISYPQRDGVVGLIFTLLVLLGGVVFIVWMAFDAARKLVEGK